ncbi:MAG: hypothetical protein QXU64_02065 [Thermofilaceae archaeon]
MTPVTYVSVSVKLTEKERRMLELLAQYLYKLGKIDQPTISNALRACLYFTINEILKAIERERMGGGHGSGW